jgi:hypothetical protein
MTNKIGREVYRLVKDRKRRTGEEQAGRDV